MGYARREIDFCASFLRRKAESGKRLREKVGRRQLPNHTTTVALLFAHRLPLPAALMSVFTNPASGAKEHAAAYTNAVLDLVGDKDPMPILRDTHRQLAEAIEDLSLAQLRQPEKPGKWSIAQVLQHLADSEIVYAWRMRLILAQDRPPLTGYDQDRWAEHLHYEQEDPADSLALFGVLRQANLRLLDRLSTSEAQRVGVHVERGDESIEHIRRMYAGHDILHLRQIDRIRGVVIARE